MLGATIAANFISACKKVDTAFWARLESDGLILLENVGSEQALVEFASQLGVIRPHRDSKENGVTVVATDASGRLEGYRGFSDEGLFPHTDRSVAPEPPSLVLLWCEHPSPEGGESLFVDGAGLFDQVAGLDADVLAKLMAPASAVFASDGQLYGGSIFESVAPDRVRLRFRYDNLLYLSKDVADVLPVLKGLIIAKTEVLSLRKGQAYLAQNTRWLHGRRPFTGSRRFGRIHIDAANDARDALAGFVTSANTPFWMRNSPSLVEHPRGYAT